MKKNLNLIIMAAILLCAACSSGDDLLDDYTESIANGSTGSSSTSSGSSSTTTNSDLSSLDVTIDSSELSETETIPTDDEDYVENYSATQTIYITYNGSSASYEGSVSGVSIAISGADVTVTSTTAGVNYVLCGSSSEGSFKVASSDNNKKFELTLAGLTLNNSDGPAINIQAGKRVYVVLKDGTTNSLSDGTSYASSTEDQKGTLFSEGQLLFSGSGRLNVSANTKAGIASDDYILVRPNTNIYVNATQGNGIKSNDGIDIRGGVINVAVSGVAAKGLSTDGYYTQSGGRVTAITTGSSEYDSDEKDVSGSAGLKADSIITINGGQLLVKSTGAGGKGISSDQAIIINNGTVKAVTTGKTYTYSSSLDSKPKGIKADGNLQINGGAIMVKASGGEGATIKISNGSTEVASYVMGRSYSGTVSFLFTAPGLTKGSSYTVTVDGTTVGTISSLASPYSSIGSSTGSMGGGGRPGGW